jgi:adenylate kinase
MKTILLHGPSGCGKDTQADLLAQNYGFEKIVTGEMFRTMYDMADIDGIKAHETWGKGLFVPDDITYRMLPRWLTRFDTSKDWIFVSVVRSQGQIALFDNLLKESNRNLDAFVHFKLSEAAAIERMALRWVCPNCNQIYHEKYKKERIQGFCDACGMKLVQREDDRPERIKSRLEEYNRTIQPILDEYRNRGILIEIDASPSIEEIHKEIITKLNL